MSAADQIRWMLGYIRRHYTYTDSAIQHEQAYGWYDRGGLLPPGIKIARNDTDGPEAVGDP